MADMDGAAELDLAAISAAARKAISPRDGWTAAIVIPYSSIIWPFSPSYGHSLDKTGRSAGGWPTRGIADRYHRMTSDGKDWTEKGDPGELHIHSKSN